MKYLALIYGDEARWEAFSADEREAVYERYRAFADAAREQSAMVDGAELAPTSTATTVRVRDGETLVSDGPFTETKETLGGFFLLECESFEQALDLAAQIPGAEHGAIEVRPCHVDDSEAQRPETEEVTA